jgi:hypothetical protein
MAADVRSRIGDRAGEPDRAEHDVSRSSDSASPCCCAPDPYAGLPPELRPRTSPSAGGLRDSRCPVCGLSYRTNRGTDVCVMCESQRGSPAAAPASREDAVRNPIRQEACCGEPAEIGRRRDEEPTNQEAGHVG